MWRGSVDLMEREISFREGFLGQWGSPPTAFSLSCILGFAEEGTCGAECTGAELFVELRNNC